MEEVPNLILSIFLDIFGGFCLFLTFSGEEEIGETLSFIPDIVGLIGLGTPLLIKRKGVGKIKKRFWLTFFAELCPILGGGPFWTIFSLSKLKRWERLRMK